MGVIAFVDHHKWLCLLMYTCVCVVCCDQNYCTTHKQHTWKRWLLAHSERIMWSISKRYTDNSIKARWTIVRMYIRTHTMFYVLWSRILHTNTNIRILTRTRNGEAANVCEQYTTHDHRMHSMRTNVMINHSRWWECEGAFYAHLPTPPPIDSQLYMHACLCMFDIHNMRVCSQIAS